MSTDATTLTTVPLKNAALAAFLAWLIPGAGHLYQGRTAKGLLFMICILGTFVFGMWLGDGRVVYASWRPDDWRLPYLCQLGVGLPALPALVQTGLVNLGKEPLFDRRMAPPRKDGRDLDDLSDWEKSKNIKFSLGSVYTMVAGLLNILAIYDAYDGPAMAGEETDEADSEKRKKDPGGGNAPPAAGK